MKIAVLNGSPKGNISVTMQYVHYIQKKFPQHELKIFNISQEIRKIERDEKAFQGIIDEVRLSDGVLWAFPLYYLHVPSQYKRFIELISERGVQDAFKGKYAASLSTSINFYDHTAHNYMNSICDDLDMSYAGSFSPPYLPHRCPLPEHSEIKHTENHLACLVLNFEIVLLVLACVDRRSRPSVAGAR